ncbi:winged helix DNA-binding domain-containing protein [Antrihabitans cavernicola]|uniref:Winged helix DNA-binding domain-containing protein n=1 Tax=Antrihabitans cavernicola TaxID=2495913 RepID=A0A5A7SAN5_9NOCA|nr:winged helix DNA-binding domain-containing protein [Spelaeibacter cavernicola]KAA0022554.1 winged helix DNA-binding domain-containing protein [Spelaeibacter cavernicola]
MQHSRRGERSRGFAPEQLSELLLSRAAVRIVCMRGTVHLLTGADAMVLRPLTQPVMRRDLSTNAEHAEALRGIDFDALAAEGRRLIEERPSSMAQLRPLLAQTWPDRTPAALAHGVRDLLPLVQVPPRGVWGKSGQPILTTLDHWLGQAIPADPAPDAMVLRYLAAYGPASVLDVQAWSGLTRLGEVLDRLRPQLEVFESESGTELFDLPDAPRPNVETTAPVRILAPFDSMLLAYADRSRFMTAEHKSLLFTVNGIIKPAVLVDGLTAGVCVLGNGKSGAVLDVELFGKITKRATTAVEREGLQLLRFAHPKAAAFDVRVHR